MAIIGIRNDADTFTLEVRAGWKGKDFVYRAFVNGRPTDIVDSTPLGCHDRVAFHPSLQDATFIESIPEMQGPVSIPDETGRSRWIAGISAALRCPDGMSDAATFHHFLATAASLESEGDLPAAKFARMSATIAFVRAGVLSEHYERTIRTWMS